MTAFLLLVLILVIATAGGFLGTLLELAAWVIFLFVVLGALLGYFLWRKVRSVLGG